MVGELIVMYTPGLQVGECKSLHVLSLRENELMEVPEELGQLTDLTVLDLVGNRYVFG